MMTRSVQKWQRQQRVSTCANGGKLFGVRARSSQALSERYAKVKIGKKRGSAH